jgi:hypothetical protein
MEILTQRILQKNCDVFSTADIEMHIKHQYSKDIVVSPTLLSVHVELNVWGIGRYFFQATHTIIFFIKCALTCFVSTMY